MGRGKLSQRILLLLAIVVGANFTAQVPYYWHQYYTRTHKPPSLIGVLLMSLVLLWFVSGYWRLRTRKTYGLPLTISFLVVEFLFYLQTQVVQLASGNGVLLHVAHPDGALLFIVFLIGYINLIAAPFLSWGLLTHRSDFSADHR